MEPPSVPPPPARAVLGGQRACDECRARKIRCDRISPCSHCRAAGLACRTTTQKPKEHKDRVQVTKQYENKIDRIESRLASIEQLLRQSSVTASLSPTQPTPGSSHGSIQPVQHVNDFESPSRSQTPAAPGDIGLRAESMAAKNVFELTMGSDPSMQQDPQLQAALESLRGIVNRTQLDATGPSRNATSSVPTRSSNEAPLPSWEEVRGLLKRAERDKPATFSVYSPTLFVDFCQKCRFMYEHGKEGSPRDKLLVYAGMFAVCSEFSGMDEGKAAEYNFSLARSFSYLLLQALSTFPMMAPPSLETVEALLAAATTTIDMCKPSLSWTLSCSAARMCQALGYNRLSRVDPASDPQYDRKVMLMWCIYIMDRNTSLRLGHAPALQDYDMDTPMIKASHDYPEGIVRLVKFWVECGRVQGRICTQLYGPAASSLTPEERAATAEALADEQVRIHQHKSENNAELIRLLSGGQYSTVRSSLELMIYGDDIMHYSTLTAALYAIPANHPHRYRALDAARDCLRLSRDIANNFLDNVYAWIVYCHWVLMHTPLTPFTGVFCHVIANPQTSKDDLQLLEDFVASLEPARRLSEGVDKFYQLCAIFSRVAQAYSRVKSQQQSNIVGMQPQVNPQMLQPAIGEFDEHFSALGFFGPQMAASTSKAPVMDATGLQPDVSMNDQQQMFDMSSLQDWYSGNVSLYSLLEQDLGDLNDLGFEYFNNGQAAS